MLVYSILHTLISKILGLFVFWIPEYILRKRFELQNKKDRGCQSFKEIGQKADLCFEFSSEGEFAQISSIVEDALLLGKKVELVLFSPSVEKQIINLYQRFPEQVRYLRYPILTFSLTSKTQCFSKWITSQKLFLVRYDLFPEFLFWSKLSGNELGLLWLTFKRNRIKKTGVSYLKMKFLKASKYNFFSTLSDQKFAERFGIVGQTYDFRMEQINRRNRERFNKFSHTLPHFDKMINHLKSFEQYFIFGNMWETDLHLLSELPEDVSSLIVPHNLDPSNIQLIERKLQGMGLDAQVIDDSTTHFTSPILILNKKGVLCELYPDFTHAYVGGGFGASVHSILEPLVGNVSQISCGPKHQRSTEFDIAFEHDLITELSTSSDFINWLKTSGDKSFEFNPSEYKKFLKDIIGC